MLPPPPDPRDLMESPEPGWVSSPRSESLTGAAPASASHSWPFAPIVTRGEGPAAANAFGASGLGPSPLPFSPAPSRSNWWIVPLVALAVVGAFAIVAVTLGWVGTTGR
jgi:hypothetical protein